MRNLGSDPDLGLASSIGTGGRWGGGSLSMCVCTVCDPLYTWDRELPSLSAVIVSSFREGSWFVGRRKAAQIMA